jgi:hypothetical protein
LLIGVGSGASSVVATNGIEKTGNPGASAITSGTNTIGTNSGPGASLVGNLDFHAVFPSALSAAQRAVLLAARNSGMNH